MPIKMADYWDIDDFLAGEEQVQVHSIKPELVQLLADSKSDSDDVKITLPIWMAETLESRDLGQVIVPAFLSNQFLESQMSCPELMNLANFSWNFYYLASRLAYKDPALAKVIPNLFMSRVKRLLKCVGLEDSSKGGLKVSCFERIIYSKLLKNSIEKTDWKERKHEKMLKSLSSSSKGPGDSIS